MAAKTDLLEDEVLNRYLRNTTALAPAAIVYVALFTGNPGEAGSLASEVAVGAYARQAVTFGAPAGNTVANTGIITFPTATLSWGLVTYMAIIDTASGAGNMLYYGLLAASKTVDAGDTVSFAIGALTISEA